MRRRMRRRMKWRRMRRWMISRRRRKTRMIEE